MPTFEISNQIGCLFVRGTYFHGVLINFLAACNYVGTVIYFRLKGSLVPRPPLFFTFLFVFTTIHGAEDQRKTGKAWGFHHVNGLESKFLTSQDE